MTRAIGRKGSLCNDIVTPTQVAAVIFAHGTARATGKPFASELVRIYDSEKGKIIRVRSFYDTGAYAHAMQTEGK